jgi:hypothetical protein
VDKEKKPLSVSHPEIASEADGWDPTTVTAGSGKKLSWKCNKQHFWLSSPYNRTKGHGCHVCSNRQILKGFNDIATTHPELAKEADGWDPTTVFAGNQRKLGWRCTKGHYWIATPNSRTSHNTGCGVCSNRQILKGFNDLATTQPELAQEADGWDPTTIFAGTDKRLNWKCKQGHKWSGSPNNRISKNTGCPVCSRRLILKGFNDFATTHPELANEADGWDTSAVTAGTREKLGWTCSKGHKWKSRVSHRTSGSGCPFCANQRVLVGFNDLKTTHPDLAREADGWDTTTVSSGSEKKLKWKCVEGHKWQVTVRKRAKGYGCPFCSNHQIFKGFNDLATTHPELAREADGWDPTTIFAGTDVKLDWKCKDGHQWSTSGAVRTRGSGCPTCATHGFDPNQNSYIYFLIQPNWELYQIGITNVPEDRLNRHKKNGFELLEIRGPMDGHTAREIETLILRFLKLQNAELSPEHIAGKFDGYSESWTIDSYKVNSLKELIDRASEAGY